MILHWCATAPSVSGTELFPTMESHQRRSRFGCGSVFIILRVQDSQHNEYSPDHNNLEHPSVKGVRNDQECLVDHSIQQGESYGEGVAVLWMGMVFFAVFLFTARRAQAEGSVGYPNDRQM